MTHDRRPFPGEYRRRCVALCLDMDRHLIERFVSHRKLTCSAASVQNWIKQYRTYGPDAFIDRRPPRPADMIEWVRLHDANGAALEVPTAPCVPDPHLQMIAFVLYAWRRLPLVAPKVKISPESFLSMIETLLVDM